jgi:hypothetical protein
MFITVIVHCIVVNILTRGYAMAQEMKNRITSELRKGPKTDNELRTALLGERSQNDKKATREYDTRYQAFRRALEDLVNKGKVAEGRFKLRGELVDTPFLAQLLKRYSQTTEDSRLLVIMQDVERECSKVGVATTPGLLEFIERQLTHPNTEVRRLALSSLRYLASALDDDRSEDRKLLQDTAEKFTPIISKHTEKGQFPLVRAEAIQLLAELGQPDSIDVLVKIAKTEPETSFKDLYDPLRSALCHRYDEYAFSKNRLKRDFKSAIHEALLNLSQTREGIVRKRADALLWHFRTDGQSHYPGGEPY